MTEKRFTIYTDQIDHWTIVGLDLLQEHTGRRLIVADIENILNDLYNKNEQLKKQLESKEKAHTRCDELYRELYDENEQLQKKNDNLVNMIARVQYRADTIKEENEQLKSEIEKLSYANEDLLSEKRNWQRMSDEYCKLSEENEQLKKEIESWKKHCINHGIAFPRTWRDVE